MTYLSQSRGLLSPQSVKQLRGYLCRAVLATNAAAYIPTSTPQPPTRTPTRSPTVTPTPEIITASDGSPMVLIPAGPFQMGGSLDDGLAECQKLFIGRSDECQPGFFDDEAPQK